MSIRGSLQNDCRAIFYSLESTQTTLIQSSRMRPLTNTTPVPINRPAPQTLTHHGCKCTHQETLLTFPSISSYRQRTDDRINHFQPTEYPTEVSVDPQNTKGSCWEHRSSTARPSPTLSTHTTLALHDPTSTKRGTSIKHRPARSLPLLDMLLGVEKLAGHHRPSGSRVGWRVEHKSSNNSYSHNQTDKSMSNDSTYCSPIQTPVRPSQVLRSDPLPEQ